MQGLSWVSFACHEQDRSKIHYKRKLFCRANQFLNFKSFLIVSFFFFFGAVNQQGFIDGHFIIFFLIQDAALLQLGNIIFYHRIVKECCKSSAEVITRS